MFRSFREMDVYDNGIVTVKAHCAIYKLSDAFGEMIFRKMFGTGRQYTIHFKEFLLISSSALSFFGEHSLAIFAFQIFDTDGSGVMTAKEVNKMVQVIWGDSSKSNREVVRALESNSVDKNTFMTLSRDFQTLLFPVFDLLRSARNNTLGEGR